MMDPVFAMDETFSLASGSRLVRRCDLTSVMQREHADGQRNFACQAHFLPHLGRCQRALGHRRVTIRFLSIIFSCLCVLYEL